MIYRHKHTIEAIQLTAELAVSCLIDKAAGPFGLSVSGHYHPGERKVYHAYVSLGFTRAEVGDWLVKDEFGVKSVSNNGFKEIYEPSPNDVDLMRQALRAHRAWHAAEEEIHRNLTTFNERMVLCNFAQWLTAKVFGHAEDYNGVPHLVVWPIVEIRRDEIEEAQALVEKVMTAVEAARDQQAEFRHLEGIKGVCM